MKTPSRKNIYMPNYDCDRFELDYSDNFASSQD